MRGGGVSVSDERRRTERVAVQIPARLLLAGGREAAVTIRNIGELGMLVSMTDLELEIHEGERALIEHPRLTDAKPAKGPEKGKVRTPASVVRVELAKALATPRRTASPAGWP